MVKISINVEDDNGQVLIDAKDAVAREAIVNLEAAINNLSNTTGIKGDKGDPGIAGAKGVTGATGVTGAIGPKGDKGDQGATGLQGLKGDKGDLGSAGAKGATGAAGLQGLKGEKGDQGPAGTKGATGAAGLQGLKGDKGDQGLAGTKGATGATGLQGLKGDKGDQGPAGPAGSGNGGMSGSDYFIELSRWGISKGTMGKPPYTNAQWAIAYNNLLGFNNALNYAKENGRGKIIVPPGIYSFCYTNLNGGAEIYQMENIPITLFDYQTLDLNGSQFEMMYDSMNKNPYDKSPASTPPWKLSGTLIDLTNCIHSHVINGKLIGDIPNRSFSDGGKGFNSEYGMEQTYGIAIDMGAKFCSAEHLEISMFMGDGIIIGSSPSHLVTWNLSGSEPKALPGYINDAGATIKEAGAYVTSKFPLIRGVHKELQMRSGGGYTRIPPIKNTSFEFIFLDKGNKVVSRKQAVYLQNVTVPFNAYFVAIQLFNEAEGLKELKINFAITIPQSSHITINNCEIHDNHRGGISGGADFTTIEKCKIYHNGMDSGLGIPLFPDSTRYGINFEDNYSNFLKIRDCHLFSGFHSILAGAYHVRIENNLIQGMNGPIIYNNSSTIIRGNTFDDSDGLGLMYSMDEQRRTIHFCENIINTKVVDVNTDDHVNTFIKMSDNTWNVDAISLSGNIEFIDNAVKALSGDNWEEYTTSSIHCMKIEGNTFENFGGNNYYRFFVSKEKGSNSVMNNNVFRNISFNNVDLYNNTEFKDCEFYNCDLTVPVQDKKSNSSLTFEKCLLQDTQIDIGGQYVNDLAVTGIVQKVIFEDSKVILTPNYTRGVLLTINDNIASTGLKAPRSYEVEFINSEFNNQLTKANTRIAAYASAVTGDYPQLKKVTIEDTTLRIADISKFNFIADESNSNPNSSVIIKNAKFRGFDAIKPTKNVKTEVYVTPLTKLI